MKFIKPAMLIDLALHFLFNHVGMRRSTSTFKINLTGFLRRILLVPSRRWRQLMARWYMNPSSPVITWMKFTLRRSCFLPLRLAKLSKKLCLRIFPRYWKQGGVTIVFASRMSVNVIWNVPAVLQIAPYIFKIPMAKKNGSDVSGLEAELKEKMAKLNEVGQKIFENL